MIYKKIKEKLSKVNGLDLLTLSLIGTATNLVITVINILLFAIIHQLQK